MDSFSEIDHDRLREELSLVSTSLGSDQEAFFQEESRMFTTVYQGVKLSFQVPDEYPHHTISIHLDIDPHLEECYLRCNDVLSDILPGECMLFVICQTFRFSVDQHKSQIPMRPKSTQSTGKKNPFEKPLNITASNSIPFGTESAQLSSGAPFADEIFMTSKEKSVENSATVSKPQSLQNIHLSRPFKTHGGYPLVESLQMLTCPQNRCLSKSSLSLLSWNVLCDLFDENNLRRSEERLPLQLKFLALSNCDIIALQEITPKFWKALSDYEPLISQYSLTYLPSDVAIGQVILSRLKISNARVLRLSPQKHAVFILLESQKNRTLSIANIQLISDFARESSSRRVEELAAICKTFTDGTDQILLGDFNFGDADTETTSEPLAAFLDSWKTLRGSEAGVTFDYENNPLSHLSCGPRKESRRLDRIMVRGLLIPTETQIVARTPDASGLFLSSHYAVRSVIHMEESFQPFVRPVQLDSNTAVVILPPVGTWKSIDKLRLNGDPYYPRWMPHIKICHPFISLQGEQLPVVMKALSSIAARCPPFRARLHNFDSKANFGRTTVGLKLEPLPPFEAAVHKLRELLLWAYSMCTVDHSPALLSIGQYPPEEAERVRAELFANWVPLIFEVTHLHLVYRESSHQCCNIIHSVALGALSQSSPSSVTASPLVTVPSVDNLEDFPPEPELPPPMVLETLPGTSKKAPESYWPRDGLEKWMAENTVLELARPQPTHVSQRGAMYHIPKNKLGSYLLQWESAIRHADQTPFCVEEVRSELFRLYVDVDFRSTVARKVHLQDTKFPALLLTHTAACFPNVDVTVAVTECHGKWEDRSHDTAVFKSGYRFYFQHVWVDTSAFGVFLESLAALCDELLPIPRNAPANTKWQEIVNTYTVAWPRARLLGSIKRRRHLWRRYRLLTFLASDSKDLSEFYEKRAIEHLSGVTTAQSYVSTAMETMSRLLFAVTVSSWDIDDETLEGISIYRNMWTESKTFTMEKMNQEYLHPLLEMRSRKPKDRKRETRDSSEKMSKDQNT